MAFVITEACIDEATQDCIDVCPVDCIHFDPDADRKLYIDPDECIDCGACQPACPVDAIFPENKVPGPMKEYVELDARWYSDPQSVRARINALKPGEGKTAVA
jgi:NAD-dependent dihydropyrimidine dehydrogenase PreA subunit